MMPTVAAATASTGIKGSVLACTASPVSAVDDSSEFGTKESYSQ
jgi:hypothetical protein